MKYKFPWEFGSHCNQTSPRNGTKNLSNTTHAITHLDTRNSTKSSSNTTHVNVIMYRIDQQQKKNEACLCSLNLEWKVGWTVTILYAFQRLEFLNFNHMQNICKHYFIVVTMNFCIGMHYDYFNSIPRNYAFILLFYGFLFRRSTTPIILF